jgi:hypothetical protein
MQPFPICCSLYAICHLPSPIHYLRSAICYRLSAIGYSVTAWPLSILSVPPCTSRLKRHPPSNPNSEGHSPSRATIFGARNLAGVAGHARRSDNKQKQ